MPSPTLCCHAQRGSPSYPSYWLRRFQAAEVKGSCSFARDCKDLQKSAHSARAAANSFRSASSKSWENGIDPVATDDPMGLRFFWDIYPDPIFGPSDARKGMGKSLRTVSWIYPFWPFWAFSVLRLQPISLLNSSMLITYICCIYLLQNLTIIHHPTSAQGQRFLPP